MAGGRLDTPSDSLPVIPRHLQTSKKKKSIECVCVGEGRGGASATLQLSFFLYRSIDSLSLSPSLPLFLCDASAP